MHAMLALDIGGTKTAAAVVTADGSRGDTVELPTRAAEGPGAVLDVATTAAGMAIERAHGALRGAEIVGVGVGTAGMVDTAGTIVAATSTFHDWVGTDLPRQLRERLDLPAAVCNDVDAHALGENWLGATAGAASSLFVAVGTGVGAAVIIDGHLLRGAHGGAGEIGHMPSPLAADFRCPCGRSGHLEAVAAGPGIANVYAAATSSSPTPTTQVVFEMARQGDRAAGAAIDRSAQALGSSLAAAITLVDPKVIAIGGGIAARSELWWQALLVAVSEHLVSPHDRVVVVRASLGAEAALVGAARYAFQTLTHPRARIIE